MENILFWLIAAAVIALIYGPFMGDKGENIQGIGAIFILALLLWPILLMWMAISLLHKIIMNALKK